MTLVYRDEIGYVQVKVDNNGIQFLNGYAYFGNDENEYKIKVENLVGVEEEGESVAKETTSRCNLVRKQLMEENPDICSKIDGYLGHVDASKVFDSTRFIKEV